MLFCMSFSGSDRERVVSMLDRDLRSIFNTHGFYRIDSDKYFIRVRVPVDFSPLYSWKKWREHCNERIIANRFDASAGYYTEREEKDLDLEYIDIRKLSVLGYADDYGLDEYDLI